MLTRCMSLVGVALLILVVSPCFAQTSRSLSPGLKRDRSALLALVNSMDKLGRSRMGAWKAKGNPCFPKPWPHVICRNGRVTAIDLANLDLVGTLPPQLKRLNKLVFLNMQNNQLAGSIPEAWSDGQQFQELRSLNLANNLLSGSLPNRKWNRKNAFRSLEELNLSENRLSDGLPDGWLGDKAPFRKLKLLDLSDNQLGKTAAGLDLNSYTGTAGPLTWCLKSATALNTDGWCPSSTVSNRLPILEILDLSQNGLHGQLPTMWPRMFPNLQSLLIHNNELYSGADSPAALPDTWTQRTVPRAFSQLQTLVLYPGNENICSIPDGEGNFNEINGELSYVVESEDEMAFDASSPWFCPGPSEDNPPTNVGLVLGQEFLKIKWIAPTDVAEFVYGYRLSLCAIDPDTEECEPTAPYIAKLLPVSSVDSGGLVKAGAVYTLTTTLSGGGTARYTASVSTFNMDGIESSDGTATSLPPPQTNDVTLDWSTGDDLNLSIRIAPAGFGITNFRYTLQKKSGATFSDVAGKTDLKTANSGFQYFAILNAASVEEGATYKVLVQTEDAAGSLSTVVSKELLAQE